ncbi:MAG: GNAT family N-acetyltransferase [Clostridia bacterium]|nr:GNAT family N-acetyltransferase [Clostridia bacterium]
MLIYAVNAKTDTGTDPFLSTGSDLAFVKQVFELTLAADWTAEGRETFARLIEAAAVFPLFRYFRAYDESAGRVAGVLAADNDLSHISLLFVHPDYMKHGVGSSLIRLAEQATTQRGLTVNAEPTAAQFYEKNGFRPCTGALETRDGITTLRMFKALKTAPARPGKRSKKAAPLPGTASHADDRT